jgi:hypothetical protein
MKELDSLFVTELKLKGYTANSLDRFSFYSIEGVKPKDLVFVKALVYVMNYNLLLVNDTKGTNKVEVLFN